MSLLDLQPAAQGDFFADRDGPCLVCPAGMLCVGVCNAHKNPLCRGDCDSVSSHGGFILGLLPWHVCGQKISSLRWQRIGPQPFQCFFTLSVEDFATSAQRQHATINAVLNDTLWTLQCRSESFAMKTGIPTNGSMVKNHISLRRNSDNL